MNLQPPAPDYVAALAHLRAADAALAAVIDRVGACGLLPTGGGFHALADAIVAQQISIQAAAAIWRRVEGLLGEVSPAAVLAQPDEALRGVGLSGQKVRYLRDLAERVADGRLDLAGMGGLADDAAITQLIAVKGIGRWTAEIYLMFALGRPDILPADDLGLRYAVQQVYAMAEPPPSAQLRVLAEPWRPFRSVASWYLWRARRLP